MLFASNQNIGLKKSISLNLWVALFLCLQVIIPLCDYAFKKLGVHGDLAPLYTRIVSSMLFLLLSLQLLAQGGVRFAERAKIYKKHIGQDLFMSLLVAGLGIVLAFAMSHFNILGRAYSVNSVVLGNLFSEAGGGQSYAGIGLIILSYCLLAPAMEELFFRRLLYVSLRQRYSLPKALMLASLLFGLIHPDAVVLSISFALVQCVVYERFGRISINIVSHMLFNFAVIALSFLGR